MKTVIISDEMTVEEVQNAFHEHFPFLKLEFYSTEHEEGEGSPAQLKLDKSLTIKEAGKSSDEGEISIHGNLKVNSLEQNFHDSYGLNVQVFRKSGELWIQTTRTDHWTLSEQNREGEEWNS